MKPLGEFSFEYIGLAVYFLDVLADFYEIGHVCFCEAVQQMFKMSHQSCAMLMEIILSCLFGGDGIEDYFTHVE